MRAECAKKVAFYGFLAVTKCRGALYVKEKAPVSWGVPLNHARMSSRQRERFHPRHRRGIGRPTRCTLAYGGPGIPAGVMDKSGIEWDYTLVIVLLC